MIKVFESTRWVIFSVFLSALMVACGGGGSGSDSINAVQSITISPTDRSYDPGESQQLTATITREDGITQSFTNQVSWSSSNVDIATVDGGLFNALTAGDVSITVTVDGIDKTETFTVADQVQRVELTRDGNAITMTQVQVLAAGETDQLEAIAVTSSNARENVTDQVQWLSSNTNAATVSQGTVTGVTRSTSVSITARFVVDGRTLTSSPAARYSITADLESIRVAPATASLPSGLEEEFTAFGTFTDGQEEQLDGVTWSVTASPADSITINAQSGIATSRTEGAVGTIIAVKNDSQGDPVSSDDSSENGQLTVVAPLVTAIDVQPPESAGSSSGTNNPQLAINSDNQYTATARYSDDSTANVTDSADWNSENPDIAVVNNSNAKGVVTGISQGTATITASFTNPDGSTPSSADDSIDVDVTEEAPSSIQISLAPGDNFDRVAVGFELQFIASGSFTDSATSTDVTDKVTWRVSTDSSIAIIDNTNRPGRLTATGADGVESVIVTATFDSNSVGASFEITVEEVNLESIVVGPEISGATGGLPVGQTRQYLATGNFVTGTAPATTAAFSMDLSDQVTWSIDPAANASVSQTGEVKGESAGDITIQADCSSNPPPTTAACNNDLNQRIGGNTDLTITNAVVTELTISTEPFVNDCSLPANDSSLSTELANGRSAQLYACALLSDGSPLTDYADNEDIVWNTVGCSDTANSSCDNFTVSNAEASKGRLTATQVGSGSVTATVQADGAQEEVNSDPNSPIAVTVSDKVLESICVEPIEDGRDCATTPADSNRSAPAGVAINYRAIGIFSAGDPEVLNNDDVSWSANPAEGVVSITGEGRITGLTEGIGSDAEIIATSGGITSADATSATFTVTAATLESIRVLPNPVSQPSQTSRPLRAEAYFSNSDTSQPGIDVTNDSNTVWSSSNTAAVIVSNASGSKGEIFARGAAGDTADVKATYTFDGNDADDTTTVSVEQGRVTAITVTPANESVAVGEDQQYTAIARRSDDAPEDPGEDVTNNENLVWSIVNTGNGDATITNAGVATGTAAGSVRVFARFTRSDEQTVSGNTVLTITAD